MHVHLHSLTCLNQSGNLTNLGILQQGLFPRERGHEFVIDGSDVETHIFMREKRSEDCFLPRRLNLGVLSMETDADYTVDGLYPLQNRAWCFQELVLSPRVLHFTHSEVVWHCRTKWHCECGAVELGGSGVRKFNAFIVDPAGAQEEDEFAQSVRWPEIEAKNPDRSWYDIVSVFTSNKITYRDDTLPALSGTVKKFQLLRGGRYIAGLWEDSFVHDLSWNVTTTDSSSRPDSYIGPSFSWCSCVSRIQWPNWTRNYIPRLEVLEIFSTIDGTDPTGKVTGAFMKVRGLMAQAHLILQTEPELNSIDKLWEMQASGEGDMEAILDGFGDVIDKTPGAPGVFTKCAIIKPRGTPHNDGEILRAARCRLDTVDDSGYASFCREKKSDGRRCDCCDERAYKSFNGRHPRDLCTDENVVHCLRILESDPEEDMEFVALVLVPTSDNGHKTFKRIGVVHNMDKEFFRDGQEQEITVI